MVLKKKVIAALQFVLEMTLFWGMTQALGIERDMTIRVQVVYFALLLLFCHYKVQTSLIWEEFLLLLKAHLCFIPICIVVLMKHMDPFVIAQSVLLGIVMFVLSLLGSRTIRLCVRSFVREKTLVIGTGRTAQTLQTIAAKNRFAMLDIVGFISIENSRYPYTLSAGCRKDQDVVKENVYPFSQLCQVIEEKQVDQLIVSSSRIDSEYMDEILSLTSGKVNTIRFVPRASGLVTFDSRVDDLNGLLLVTSFRKRNMAMGKAVKRLVDIAGGLSGCLMLLPISLAVKLINMKNGDHDPILFMQERIGKDGKPFQIYKYRTMVPDAEQVLEKMMREDEAIREEYLTNKKIIDDPRITKAGAFLRKSSLDELPQLINVLKGEMSLVGPRPYLPREKEDMGSYYQTVIKCRPGITGMWQSHGRSDVGFHDRLKMDEYYQLNWSIWLDIVILIQTVQVVTGARGAR